MKFLALTFATLSMVSACSDDTSAPNADLGTGKDAATVAADGSASHDGAITADGSGPASDNGAAAADSGAPEVDLGPRTAGNPTEITNFGSNPGSLKMWEVVPTNMPPKRPLVVVLHACNNQDIQNYNLATGWGDLAAKKGFYVLYPQTNLVNNVQGCFNWFLSSDATRDQGEAGSIKQGIDAMLARHDIDTSKIFVSGFSAGAAMSAAMLANYPEVFAAGGIIAGVPYGCATDLFAAFTCLAGEDKTPAVWRDKVRAATSYTGTFPRVAIFHGTSDGTVDFKNFNELIEQWTAVHDTDQTPDRTATVGAANLTAYSAGGVEVVIALRIDGFPHSYPQRNPSAPDVLTEFWGI